VFRKILVGLDGSDTSWAAFHRALDIAQAHGAELWVLSVEDHLPHFPGTIDEVQEEEERENSYFREVQQTAREAAAQQGVALRTRTVTGHAADRLIEFARDAAVDLIVVGHRGHANPWHHLIGSTADRLVDHAPCCVLVERLPAEVTTARGS